MRDDQNDVYLQCARNASEITMESVFLRCGLVYVVSRGMKGCEHVNYCKEQFCVNDYHDSKNV